MKIIVDTNLWISFIIGKRLSVLKSLLSNSEMTLYVCDELLEEIQDISSKQKIRKYVDEHSIIDTFRIINEFCKYAVIDKKATSPVRDTKDLYLLSLAETIRADYILTGDKDLLSLGFHYQTKIVTYKEFEAIIEE